MKELIVIFFVLLYTLSNAQNWCPQGATWTYRYFSMPYFDHQQLFYEKDTIVESKTCQKIKVQYISRFSCLDTVDVESESLFTYSQNDTVWFYYKQAFRPVYFFNAQQGDTLEILNALTEDLCDSVIKQIVDSSGTTQVNNETLRFYVAKHINITSQFLSPDKITIIEKIGAANNYILPYFTCYTDGDQHDLKCYQDADLGIYQTNPQISCACIATSITSNLILDNNISIFPNPANTIINITSQHHDIHEVIFYNLHGQRKNVSLSNNPREIQVDISSLPAGIYLLHLQFSDDKRAIKKIIKE